MLVNNLGLYFNFIKRIHYMLDFLYENGYYIVVYISALNVLTICRVDFEALSAR